MMIAKDTQFSVVKAFVHWYLLMCAGMLAGGGVLMLLAELSPLFIFGKGNELFSGVVAIAGLAWVVWTVRYIGRRGERYTKRVVPMAAGDRAVGGAATGWSVHPFLTDPEDNDYAAWSSCESSVVVAHHH